MRKILTLITLLTLSWSLQAQKLTGLWYSQDSTRIYEIKQVSDNKYIAVITRSTRKGDSVGYEVIRDLQYNRRKKRYEGAIYAVSDGQPTFVKIRFDKKNANTLILKLNRLFIMDVSLNWVKV